MVQNRFHRDNSIKLRMVLESCLRTKITWCECFCHSFKKTGGRSVAL